MIQPFTHRKISRLLPRAALFCAALLIGSAPVALADTTYTYTGNQLTLLPGPGNELDSCAILFCAVSINFTLPQALAPNLFDASIAPTNFTFGDGVVIFFPTASTSAAFVITTDSSGNITNWAVSIDDMLPGTAFSFIFFTNNGEDFEEFFETGAGTLAEATNSGEPGTWSVSTTGPPATPEPSSLLLLGTGVLSLGPFIRRRFVGSSSHSN